MYEVTPQLIAALVAVSSGTLATRELYERLTSNLEDDIEENNRRLQEIVDKINCLSVGVLALAKHNQKIDHESLENAMKHNGYEPEDFIKDSVQEEA